MAKHGMKGGGRYEIGYHPVGGYKHGGSVKDGRITVPYPLDMSDYDGGSSELRPKLAKGASGNAGGYRST